MNTLMKVLVNIPLASVFILAGATDFSQELIH